VTASPLPSSAEVVIVGAGLAGLVAARVLQNQGISSVILEASDGVGGRVRSDEVDGFILDRGFQVMLTAYPEIYHHLDIEALDFRTFEPGAIVWREGKGTIVGDPFRRPKTLASTTFAPIGTVMDKARIALLRLRLKHANPRALLRGKDIPTVDALRGAGFSPKMIERFFKPLVGGIQLDPTLSTSRRMFDIIFRTLSTGDSAVPARGMGQITQQLASSLHLSSVHLNTAVTSVESGRVTIANGHSISAKAIIVATEGPIAAQLLGLPEMESRAAGCVYFAAPVSPIDGAYIVLDGHGKGPVLNVAVMSNVSPHYAPHGQHLIAAAMPGVVDGDLEAAARRQLKAWWGNGVDSWRHLRTYRIAHGQPNQNPPFHHKKSVSLGDGLFVCGDHRDTGSIQGAMFSGRRCAEEVASWVRLSS
jgi:phytoene dehydrogenase-like protein